MNIEKEKKYLIQGLSKYLLNGVEHKDIMQYYLNLDNDLKHIIKVLFNLHDRITKTIIEARIRNINKNGYVITIKSGGSNNRYEFEKPISKEVALKIIHDKSIGYVAKTRFVYNGVEIDFFKNRDLCLAEMEYDDMTEKEVDEYIYEAIKEICDGKAQYINAVKIADGLIMNSGRIQFDIPMDAINIKDVKITDVTDNAQYKNRNLMTPYKPIENIL